MLWKESWVLCLYCYLKTRTCHGTLGKHLLVCQCCLAWRHGILATLPNFCILSLQCEESTNIKQWNKTHPQKLWKLTLSTLTFSGSMTKRKRCWLWDRLMTLSLNACFSCDITTYWCSEATTQSTLRLQTLKGPIWLFSQKHLWAEIIIIISTISILSSPLEILFL